MTHWSEGLTKAQIRSKIILRLKNQKEEERERKSRIIKDKLFRTRVFKAAKKVMFYIPLDGEVNTQMMIKAAQRLGKTVVVPVCKKNRIMRPALLTQNAKLKTGLYGILEPAHKRYLKLKDLDLVIVPGLAFDRKGRRLGRGKGYYDRFLRRLPSRVTSLGLAFKFQLLPYLPAQRWDVNVKRVIFA